MMNTKYALRALALAAVLVASSCAPVSNSISKTSFETHSQQMSAENHFASLTVIPKVIVTTESEFIREETRLPNGVKVAAIPSASFDEFSVLGSTEIELTSGLRQEGIEVYAILELAVNPREADRTKMKNVELKWVKKGLNRFLISFSREAGDEDSRKYVRGLLSRISVGYREVGGGVTR